MYHSRIVQHSTTSASTAVNDIYAYYNNIVILLRCHNNIIAAVVRAHKVQRSVPVCIFCT